MPNLLGLSKLGFRDRPLLFIDLETTGLDPAIHEIIEIAALRVNAPEFAISSSYYTQVLPTHPQTADPRALEVTGYSKQKWTAAIPLRQALLDISALAPNCILAGWSVHTEWDFLNAALKKERLPYFYTHRVIEVFTLAYIKLFPDQNIRFLNLATASKALGISLDQHKPDSDIRATFEIFTKLASF